MKVKEESEKVGFMQHLLSVVGAIRQKPTVILQMEASGSQGAGSRATQSSSCFPPAAGPLLPAPGKADPVGPGASWVL